MTLARRYATEKGWREAVYSNCELYRYRLTLCWDDTAPVLLCVMLNPSTATERANDPTIERCERRTRFLGYGSLTVVNLFGLRATSPSALRAAADPVGADNDLHLIEAAATADAILAAWGVHGAHLGRGTQAETTLRTMGKSLLTLGLTKDGHPRHPLYVAYTATPRAW